MSSSDSSESNHPEEYDYKKEKILREIKKRPALWNKDVKEYKDRSVTAKLWTEVASKVVPNFENLSNAHKNKHEISIRKRWKHMRDYYIREMRESKTGQSQRQKKYAYFHLMSFLTSTDTNSVDITTEKKEEYQNSKNLILSPKKKNKMRKQQRRPRLQLNTVRQKVNNLDLYDEDINFSKMIVPMLKKLDDDQKHFAKVEILNVLKNAKLIQSTTTSMLNSLRRPKQEHTEYISMSPRSESIIDEDIQNDFLGEDEKPTFILIDKNSDQDESM